MGADDVKIGCRPRKDPSNPDARKGKQGQSTKGTVNLAPRTGG
jgi:hypothetical protein